MTRKAKRLEAYFDNYYSTLDDVREEIVKRIHKYEKENFKDTGYYFGFVDGVDTVIGWIDEFMDACMVDYETEEPGSRFGPPID